MSTIAIEPLTRSGFAAFGEVVETDGTAPLHINQGFAERFSGLCAVAVSAAGGSANISIFEARARPRPIAVALMERHPLGTQLFMPLQDAPWLVVVCGEPRTPSSYRAFLATGRQGVSYAPNVWHHPLLVLQDGERFIVVDRAGPGSNLEEVWLDAPHQLGVIPDRCRTGQA